MEAARLAEAADRWSDRTLDGYRLPHPRSGKLTVREMPFFTLYHNARHARCVAEPSVGKSYALEETT